MSRKSSHKERTKHGVLRVTVTDLGDVRIPLDLAPAGHKEET